METNARGYLILKKRKEKHMTQKELAEKLYVSPSTVSKWEKGTTCPDLDKLKRLSAVLEIPLSDLLGADITVTDEPDKKIALTIQSPAEEPQTVFESETPGPEIPTNQNPSMGKLRKKLRGKKGLMIAAAVLVLLFCIGSLFLRHQNITAADEFVSSSALELLDHFHGSYYGTDACFIIAKCDEIIHNHESLRDSYSENLIRTMYSGCFDEVDNIVIFFVPSYSENDDLEDTACYITTLYPLPDLEE